MKFAKLTVLCEFFLIAGLASGAAIAAGDFSHLGKDLTPWGAPKAGSPDGTIPAWDGVMQKAPTSFDPKKGYVSPFPDEKPQYTITAANYKQYESKLTAGHIQLLKRYPSYKINVYPSHRTHALPQSQYDAIAKEGPNVKLTADGNGFAGTRKSTVPFPFPQSAYEVYHNMVMRWRGGSYDRVSAGFPVQGNGRFTPSVRKEEILFSSDIDNPPENLNYYGMITYTAPSSIAGELVLVHEPINQGIESRRAWAYNPGSRRVLRAPQIGFDSPLTGSDGLMTQDDFDGLNGSPERFEWKLVGKREMIIPYNNFKMTDKSLKYTDIAKAQTVNQDLVRYETHRVYVLEATLKPGARHIYSKRRVLVDEDSFQVAHVDNYDGRGELWRAHEVFAVYASDCQCTFMAGDVSYDFQAGRYAIYALTNEERPAVFGKSYRREYFTPDNMKRLAR